MSTDTAVTVPEFFHVVMVKAGGKRTVRLSLTPLTKAEAQAMRSRFTPRKGARVEVQPAA